MKSIKTGVKQYLMIPMLCVALLMSGTECLAAQVNVSDQKLVGHTASVRHTSSHAGAAKANSGVTPTSIELVASSSVAQPLTWQQKIQSVLSSAKNTLYDLKNSIVTHPLITGVAAASASAILYVARKVTSSELAEEDAKKDSNDKGALPRGKDVRSNNKSAQDDQGQSVKAVSGAGKSHTHMVGDVSDVNKKSTDVNQVQGNGHNKDAQKKVVTSRGSAGHTQGLNAADASHGDNKKKVGDTTSGAKKVEYSKNTQSNAQAGANNAQNNGKLDLTAEGEEIKSGQNKKDAQSALPKERDVSGQRSEDQKVNDQDNKEQSEIFEHEIVQMLEPQESDEWRIKNLKKKIKAAMQKGVGALDELASGDGDVFSSRGDALLHSEIKYGTAETVRMCIQCGAGVNVKSEGKHTEGYTPLHIACDRGKDDVAEIITMLLGAGANVNARDDKDNTPLMVASNNGQDGSVGQLLIDAGADINACNNDKKTALTLALSWGGGNVSMVECLCNVKDAQGAIVVDVNARDIKGDTPLMLLSKWSKKGDLLGKLLIDAGANVNAENDDNKTALALAISNHNTSMVRCLCSAKDKQGKAFVDFERHGAAIFHDAVKKAFYYVSVYSEQDLEIVDTLLNCGEIDIDVPYNGKTALMEALEYGKTDAVRMLCAKGANLNLLSMKHSYTDITPLMWAYINDKKELFEVLLNTPSVDIGVQTVQGNTVLHRMLSSMDDEVKKPILSRRKEMLTSLLEFIKNKGLSAVVKIKNEYGQTALHEAVAHVRDDVSIAQLLVEAGADIGAKSNHDRTVLHRAVDADCRRTVQWLMMQDGININDQDKDGNTALMNAVVNGNVELVKMLLGAHEAYKPYVDEACSYLGQVSGENLRTLIDDCLQKTKTNLDAKNVKDETALYLAMPLMKRQTRLSAYSPGQTDEEFARSFAKGKEIVDLLINAGADTTIQCGDWSLLVHAVQTGNIGLAADLLAKGVTQNVCNMRHARDPLHNNIMPSNFITPLMWAVYEDNVAMFELLLQDQHVNANIVDSVGGNTVLHAIIHSMKHRESGGVVTVNNRVTTKSMLKTLLASNKFNAINAKATNKGRTALHMAVLLYDREVMRMLIEHDADVNERDFDGSSPLMLASKKEFVGGVEELLAANKDHVTEASAVISARAGAQACPQGIDSCLAEYLGTINLDLKNYKGEAALRPDVRSKDNKQIIKLLVEAGVDIQGRNGDTLLTHAVKEGSVNMAKLLLEERKMKVYGSSMSGLLGEASRPWQQEIKQLLLNTQDRQDAEFFKEVEARSADDEKGEAEKGQQKLLQYVDVNATDGGGDTLLHTAIREGHIKSVELLLSHKESKALLSAKNGGGQDALIVAAQDGRSGMVQLFLSKGADASTVDRRGCTALKRAVIGSHKAIVEMLLTAGAQPDGGSGKTALMHAAEAGQSAIAEMLLNAKNPADICAEYKEHDEQLCIPLTYAARVGADNVVNMLIEKMWRMQKFSDVNQESEIADVNQESEIAMDFAVRRGHVDRAFGKALQGGHKAVVQSLLPFKVTEKTNENTIGYWCQVVADGQRGNVEDIRAMLQVEVPGIQKRMQQRAQDRAQEERIETFALSFGIRNFANNVMQKCDGEGNTLLHKAAASGQSEHVAFLIKKGGKKLVVALNNNGETALMKAAQAGHKNVVEQLVNAPGYNGQANPQGISATDNNGFTGLMHAVEGGNREIVELLLDRKADVNGCNQTGLTALMIAAQDADIAIAELLVNRGARMCESASNKMNGRTVCPLSLAAGKGRVAMVEWLLKTMKTKQTSVPGLTVFTHAMISGQIKGALECARAKECEAVVGILAPLFESPVAKIGNNGAAAMPYDVSDSDTESESCSNAESDSESKFVHSEAFPEDNIADIERASLSVLTQSCDDYNNTYLHRAAKNGQFNRVAFLIKKCGHDLVVAQNNYRETALMQAAREGHADVVEQLFNAQGYYAHKGAPIADENGFTGLMHAVAGNNPKIVEFLLKRGVDMNEFVKAGVTALDVASNEEFGCEEMAELLTGYLIHGVPNDVDDKEVSQVKPEDQRQAAAEGLFVADEHANRPDNVLVLQSDAGEQLLVDPQLAQQFIALMQQSPERLQRMQQMMQPKAGIQDLRGNVGNSQQPQSTSVRWAAELGGQRHEIAASLVDLLKMYAQEGALKASAVSVEPLLEDGDTRTTRQAIQQLSIPLRVKRLIARQNDEQSPAPAGTTDENGGLGRKRSVFNEDGSVDRQRHAQVVLAMSGLIKSADRLLQEANAH